MKAFPALLAALSVAGCATATHSKTGAFGPAPAGAGVAAPADSKPLTAEQLRACIEDRKQVQQGAPAAQADQAEMGKRKAALEARKAQLESQKPEPGSARKTIEAYNAQVHAFEADSKSYASDVSGANGRIQAVNGAGKDFNSKCAGRSFSQDDLDAIMKDYPGVTL